jgi:hypothetical protein
MALGFRLKGLLTWLKGLGLRVWALGVFVLLGLGLLHEHAQGFRLWRREGRTEKEGARKKGLGFRV